MKKRQKYYKHNIIVNWFVIDCVQDEQLLYCVKFIDNEPIEIYSKKWFNTEDIDFEFLLSQQL